jgi:hypothetical protein
MAGLMRIPGSIRWPFLALLLPLFLALGSVAGTGGWLLVTTASLLVLFWGLLNDAAQLERARNPRLGLSCDRADWSEDTVIGLRTLVGAASLIASIALAFVAPAVGLWALASWAALLLLCWLDAKLDGRRRFWMAELAIPLVAAILPVLLVARATRPRDAGAQAATDAAAGAANAALPAAHDATGIVLLALLTAFALCSVLLLCLIRDEIADADAGYRTTATMLGRSGAVTLLTLWQIGTVAIAGIGVQADAWNWAVPTLLASGALASSWLLASRTDGISVVVWWLAGAAAVWATLAG